MAHALGTLRPTVRVDAVREPPDSPLRVVALAVTAVLVVSLLLSLSPFTGLLRWLLVLAFLGILAALAWTQVSRRASEVAPLVPPHGPEAIDEGALAELTAAVRRADDGLLYSEMLVASRARDAFATRVRLARGLPEERMRGLQGDREGLKALLHDDVLADFLAVASNDWDERYRWVRGTRSRGKFEREFRKVLDRMEAWR